jgi:hypothetical protein
LFYLFQHAILIKRQAEKQEADQPLMENVDEPVKDTAHPQRRSRQGLQYNG